MASMLTSTPPFLPSAAGIILGICVLFILGHRHPRYPPGPPSLPLVGHLFAVPADNQHLVFHEWAKKYGRILHLSVFGKHTVILDDVKTCIDLLEKRGAIYSDRPQMVTFDLLNMDDLPVMSYGERFRRHRKLIHSKFTKTACNHFLEDQRQNAFVLASRLLQSPYSECEEYLLMFAGSVVTKTMSGHLIVSPQDEWIDLMKEHTTVLHDSVTMGGNFLEFIPLVRHLPPWFPGAGLILSLRKKDWVLPRIYDKSFEQVQQQLAKGIHEPSIISDEIKRATETESITDEHVDDLKRMAGGAMRAASDTTASTLYTFILIMMLYPSVQKRAQEEVDRVVGSKRMPEFTDSLPYVSALVRELLRWNAIVALGVAHQSTEDDIYDGYFIPKGTTIITNIHGMSRDETVYHDPSKFDPSRFLPYPEGRGEPNFDAAFGFGRRICPGRHFAYNAIWIAVATCLATVHFSKHVNADGEEVILDPEFSSGFISSPKPFPFKVVARSAKASQLLQTAAQDALDTISLAKNH